MNPGQPYVNYRLKLSYLSDDAKVFSWRLVKDSRKCFSIFSHISVGGITKIDSTHMEQAGALPEGRLLDHPIRASDQLFINTIAPHALIYKPLSTVLISIKSLDLK
jgi:hypothetical protein